MAATVFYFLMLQKYVSSKQKILKWKNIPCVYKIFQRILQLITWKKKTGLNGYVYEFSVDYNVIDTSNIIDIHKYLTKKHDLK